MKRIINDSSIWDLHIHSCKSPKSTGEFQKMEVDEYIKLLLDIFKDYPNLSLISFTDHNYISYEVYEKFVLANSGIAIVPGIEIDVKIKGIKDPKHLIFYFNLEIEQLESFADKINDLLNEKSPIEINDILEFLITEKVEFLISPHAFKQNQRGINYDWNDEDTTKSSIDKFMDQFFCFWETSGYSQIAKAIEFLKDFDREERISIISFSDSSSEKKLKDYLSNPPQYFKSLPTFKGIQLVGTDSKRILKEQKKVNEDDSGNVIGFIKINGEEIQLSDQLNAVVGGRGSGKSLFLDNIAINMDTNIKNESRLNKDRLEYLARFPIEFFNLDRTKIEIDSKKVDYYDQSYVSKIFNSNDINLQIQSYFKDEFDSLGDMNKEQKLNTFKSTFDPNSKYKTKSKPGSNISNFVGKYINIDENAKCLRFKKSTLKEVKQIEYNIDDAIEEAKRKNKLIPKELKENSKVNRALLDLISVINTEVHELNYDILKNKLDFNIKKKCISYLESKSDSVKNKNEQESLFLEHFRYEYKKYEERAAIVNELITMQNDFRKEELLFNDREGVNGNVFRFEKKLVYEEPLVYFKRLCEKYCSAKVKEMNSDSLLHMFIFDLEDNLKNSKTVDDFINDLKSFESYKLIEQCNILYGETKDSLKSINYMSPGTKTNILMEYIVSKDTKIPLLIDQPEDNIDNETIYNKLTKWFRELKLKRQVIVVTHDANIVVNADAENVIIATKESDDSFSYDYGALEYDEILNRISIILDGGVKAVERRLKKYGREDN